MNKTISVAAIGALTVGACAMAPPPPHGAPPGYVCDGSNIQQFVGREASSALAAEMLRVSGARTIRWVQPGMMVTMEFRADRLTVFLDSSNRVERISCS